MNISRCPEDSSDGRVRTLMEKRDMLLVLQTLAAKYAPDCLESIQRNRHMSKYNGEEFDEKAVLDWLRGFGARFVRCYKGSLTRGDVMTGMASCAKTWRLSGLECSQDTRDAIIVDYVNFVAAQHCCMDLALYTVDMGKTEPSDLAYSETQEASG